MSQVDAYNVITPISRKIEEALAELLEHRLVTRNYKDFADYEAQDLDKGIFTLLGDGLDSINDYTAHIKFVLLIHAEQPENDPGECIEDIENTMICEALTCFRYFNPMPDVLAVRQSRQLESPNGWAVIDFRIGPYDLAWPVEDDELDNFETIHIDYDISPFSSQQQQTDWSSEDYSSEDDPDAQADHQLEQ